MNSEVFAYSNDSYRFYLDACKFFSILHCNMCIFQTFYTLECHLLCRDQFGIIHFKETANMAYVWFQFSSRGSLICNNRSAHCDGSYLQF